MCFLYGLQGFVLKLDCLAHASTVNLVFASVAYYSITVPCTSPTTINPSPPPCMLYSLKRIVRNRGISIS